MNTRETVCSSNGLSSLWLLATLALSVACSGDTGSGGTRGQGIGVPMPSSPATGSTATVPNPTSSPTGGVGAQPTTGGQAGTPATPPNAGGAAGAATPNNGGAGGSVAGNGGSGGQVGGAAGAGGEPAGSGGSENAPGKLAEGIRLTEIELNQGTGIPLAQEGEPLADGDRIAKGDQSMKLVKNRGGLLRAFYELTPAFQNRELEGRLTVVDEGGEETVLTDVRMVDGPPDPSKLDGTFEWLIEPELVSPGAKYALGIYDTSPQATEDFEDARIPKEGLAELDVPEVDLQLNVTIVPVIHNGIEPNLSEEQVKKLEDGYFDMNPVSQVNIKVREESVTIQRDDIGQVLNAAMNARSADQAPRNVYYLGLVSTRVINSVGVASNNSAASFVADPINFPQEPTVGFAVHETGHNQGLAHNPGCQAGGPDRNWPYGDSDSIEVQGYGIRNEKLFSTEQFKDYMNYCTPDWVSPFTYMLTYRNLEQLGRQHFEAVSPSHYVLHGIIQPSNAADWWAMPADLPSEPEFTTGRVRLTLNDGSITELLAQVEPVSDSASVMVKAKLPGSVGDISKLEVWANERTYDVDPSKLTEQYDAMVAEKALAKP